MPPNCSMNPAATGWGNKRWGGGSSPLPIPWGFLPHPKLPLQPARFPKGRKLIFSIVDRALAMPAGVVLPLTVLAQAFLPVGFITHRGSVRGPVGQWLTHWPGCFQENFVPARTHLYGRAESFSDPRPPVVTLFCNPTKIFWRIQDD